MADSENNVREIIEGIARVEEFNDQFRQPNRNGRYPLCCPIVGDLSSRCERCGEYAGKNRPCPAVPPEQRWGEDYIPEAESAIASP